MGAFQTLVTPRTPLRLLPKPRELACVGQQCPERESCVRWLRPAGARQTWASFDIERQHFGTCESRLPFRMLGKEVSNA